MANKKEKKNPLTGKRQKFIGTFATQRISQADQMERRTGVALPDDQNVEDARDWVNFNKL